jgi:hypothetical protein
MDDDSGDTGVMVVDSFDISDNLDQWLFCVLTHDSSADATWLRCLDVNGNAIRSTLDSGEIGSISPAAGITFGNTNNPSSAWQFEGDLAEWGILPGVFTTLDIFRGFLRGGRIHRWPGATLAVPMIGDRYETWATSLVTTNNGATPVVDGPRLQLITPPALNTELPAVPDPEPDASSDLGLTQVAFCNRDLPLSLTSTLTIVDVAGQTKELSEEDDLGFASIVGHLNLQNDRAPARSVMALTQTVQALASLGVDQSLGITHGVAIQFPIKPHVTSVLGLSARTSTPFRAYIEDVLTVVQFIPTPLPIQHLAHTISFAQDAPIGRVDDVLNLVQVAAFAFSLTAAHNLGVEDSVAMVATWIRSVEHSDVVGHSLTWYEDRICARKNYSPFQGETTLAGAPAPPSPTLQDPQGDTGNFSLYQPSLGVPLKEVTLRKPAMDNRDRNAYTRVNQETRGGRLIIYADPQWPKVRTLAVTIVGLTEADVDGLQAFMEETLGQQIGLTDWEGRLWQGFITNPNEAATQDGRKMWTVSFEFEGEMLDVEQPGNDDGNGMAMNMEQSVTAVIV